MNNVDRHGIVLVPSRHHLRGGKEREGESMSSRPVARDQAKAIP